MEHFLDHIDCDYVMQMNPTSPFITVEDLIGVKDMMINGKYDTIQVVRSEQIEAIYEGKPLNYEPMKIMPESQYLKPVSFYTNGIMAFKKDVHQRNMKELGAATYGGAGKTGFYELKGFSTVDLDDEEDFHLAETIYQYLHSPEKRAPRYYE